ncbi:MAG: peptidoglycan DD-metalloendopeptidase family protein [Pseudomonadota bacterium]
MQGWPSHRGLSIGARVVVSIALAGAAAGCSSGNIRLAGTPLFASSSSAAPTALAPIESSDLPPATAATAATTGGPVPLTTSAALEARGYTLENAQAVDVGPGDTATTLSQGFGVPVDIIVSANGLKTAADIRPGQRLLVPRKVNPVAPPANAVALAPTATVVDTAPSPLAVQVAPPAQTLDAQTAERRHVVKDGDTLWSISTSYGVTTDAVAALNGLRGGVVKVGETLRIPPQSATQVAALSPRVAAPVTDAPAATTPPQAVQPGAPATPTAIAPKTETIEQASAPSASSASGFRWPVRGRIIAGFGKQADGGRNDGINLAVPAGTPVRAAEAGKVIYAGNELEGYGNLILVQHSGDWVSAYAHNESLDVARGDRVERGQPIARAGQSGSVDQPQLHFELRKKSKPVDPLPHLSGA